MGLVQCELEAAGFTTISLSMIPELTASTGAPRIAGVERPFGMPLGLPGDAAGQRAVLRGAVQAIGSIPKPGGVVDLGLDWPDDLRVNTSPPKPPPIVSYLKRHPWALAQFYSRTPPH
ncbi:MAG: hypothetical protein K2X35_19950 [Bryobacteraceae bacterium]|nr:hypothetical protein [Bryobacteraceae bacterium]